MLQYDDAHLSIIRLRTSAVHLATFNLVFHSRLDVAQTALGTVQIFVMSFTEPVHAIDGTLDFWYSLPRVPRAPQIDALSGNMLSVHVTA